MKVELCDEFLFRINSDVELFANVNTSKENVLRNNNNIPFYNGEWVKVKINDYITHHVKPMDSLIKVSNIYGVAKEKILYDNNLTSENLFIGQQLKIFKK